MTGENIFPVKKNTINTADCFMLHALGLSMPLLESQFFSRTIKQMFEMHENTAFIFMAISETISTFWKFLVAGSLHKKIKLFRSSNLCVLCISFDGIDIIWTPKANKHACETSTIDSSCENKIYNLKL